MGTLLRCGKHLRTRIVSASAQQLRHQSVFSDITSKLKQQVESNPELKDQINRLKDTAGSLRQQAAAGAQQAQEVLEHLANQQKGSGGAPPQQAATEDKQPGGSHGATANAQSQQQGQQQEQQQHAAGAAGGFRTDTSGAGSADPGGSASGSASMGDDANAGGGEPGTSSHQASGQSSSWAARGRRAMGVVWQEVTEAISPSPETTSATKRRADALRQSAAEGGGPSEVLIVEQPESAWRKRWNSFAGRYADHALFRRLSSVGSSAAARSRDAAEDLRERWETSDSPFVHRIQDMSDSVFTETEMARAYREIGVRDPAFDMPAFLRQIKADVPTIIRAYLEGEIDVLKEHCSPEMVERLTAIIRAQQAQGMFSDATLLDISDVELADIKFLEDDPVIVVQFNCQQINCTRDKFGNVTEGAPDEVTRVFYFWALQQEAAGFVSTDGKLYPPRWQLREMLVQGMMPLVS